jgi:predicted DCC family thiol-disulfide oxidoreductase YuxK
MQALPTINAEQLMQHHPYILLFDGDCSLCNRSANLILRWETKALVAFAALDSTTGQSLASAFFPATNQPDSIIFIDNGKAYTKSDAALRVAKIIGGVFHLFRFFWIVPKPLRDAFYDLIARKRLSWFGKTTYCGFMPQIERNRFLDV